MKLKLDNNVKSGSIDITQGVLQGDTLSPILFSMFIHDIIKFSLKEGHIKIEEDIDLLLFADDLILLAKMNTLDKYCTIKTLIVNPGKTEILIF